MVKSSAHLECCTIPTEQSALPCAYRWALAPWAYSADITIRQDPCLQWLEEARRSGRH